MRFFRDSIGVVGLWHLGCVICASWSKFGKNTIGFDYNLSRIKHLKKGIPPLYEPGLAGAIRQGIKRKSLFFSNNINSLSHCDFIFLSYDTPVRDDDSCNIKILMKSIKDLSEISKDGTIIIVSSQLPVGLSRLLRKELKQNNPSLELVYSPENLRLGEAINCYMKPSRVILGGVDRKAIFRVKSLFSQITPDILSMNLESAEMVKHGINSFLATSIVFSNHIADICEMVGARIDDVIKGLKSDPRIGERSYLSPGIGFSGGTLGRDLRVLARINSKKMGFAKIFKIVYRLNQERRNVIVNKIIKILGSIKGAQIGILGITYKPGTSTLRRSLALEIAGIIARNNVKIKIFDPKADYSEVSLPGVYEICKDLEAVSENSDILVLLTEWSDFKKANWKVVAKKMKRKLFFDTKNFLDEKLMSSYGFKYYSIGR